MAENNDIIKTDENPLEQDYLEEIKRLKENTVSKETYDKQVEENRKLLNSLVNGNPVEVETPKEEHVDPNELRKKLFSGDLNNLEFWKTTLKLREEEIKAGHQDPFLPTGHQITPSASDSEKIENLVNIVESCIDDSNGDSLLFTNLLQSKTKEALPMSKLKELGLIGGK